jgi:hypothetical protein
MKCKYCKKEYDKEEVKRTLGEESAVYILDYCSAQCYTKNMTNRPDSKTKDEYFDIISDCSQVFEAKLEDYGASWRVFRLNAIIDQIFIKIKRIRQIETTKENKVGDDPVNDYMAIINYCLIGLIQLDLDDVTNPEIDSRDAYMLYSAKIQEAWSLLEKKNADYGEAWRDMHIESFTDLMLTKILRIKQIAKNGGTTVSEGIDSNYFDIMNYAVFALIKKGK